VRRVFLAVAGPVFNPIMLALTRTTNGKMMPVIHHRGRKSGRDYATPVSARRTAEGFVVPMTFGDQADWFKNVAAAGGCVLEWNGIRYPVVNPRIVGWTDAGSAFKPVERAIMRVVMGMENFVLLRHARADEASFIGSSN
jgi:deazaflavin-dependent oxidoreductase (nitroreductase family)